MAAVVKTSGDLRARLASLGRDGNYEVFVDGGHYKVDSLYTPDMPEGHTGLIRCHEEVVIDLGCMDWTNFWNATGSQYRNVILGQGVHWLGGQIKNTAMMGLLVGGGNGIHELTFGPCLGNGPVEKNSSTRSTVWGSCIFQGVGAYDPGPDDPLWKIVARVKPGTILEGGGMTFDIWDAVLMAGHDHMAKYDPGLRPITNDDHARERVILFSYCKQVGYKGAGKHCLYLNSPTHHIVENCEFKTGSGYGVFMNPKRGTLKADILNNIFSALTAAYSTWGPAEALFASNTIEVHPKTYGPKWATGFVLNDEGRPLHRDNEFTWIPGQGVTAYRLWNSSPLPIGWAEDVKLTPEGTDVPEWGNRVQVATSPISEIPDVPDEPDKLAARVAVLEEELKNLIERHNQLNAGVLENDLFLTRVASDVDQLSLDNSSHRTTLARLEQQMADMNLFRQKLVDALTNS